MIFEKVELEYIVMLSVAVEDWIRRVVSGSVRSWSEVSRVTVILIVIQFT